MPNNNKNHIKIFLYFVWFHVVFSALALNKNHFTIRRKICQKEKTLTKF